MLGETVRLAWNQETIRSPTSATTHGRNIVEVCLS